MDLFLSELLMPNLLQWGNHACLVKISQTCQTQCFWYKLQVSSFKRDMEKKSDDESWKCHFCHLLVTSDLRSAALALRQLRPDFAAKLVTLVEQRHAGMAWLMLDEIESKAKAAQIVMLMTDDEAAVVLDDTTDANLFAEMEISKVAKILQLVNKRTALSNLGAMETSLAAKILEEIDNTSAAAILCMMNGASSAAVIAAMNRSRLLCMLTAPSVSAEVGAAILKGVDKAHVAAILRLMITEGWDRKVLPNPTSPESAADQKAIEILEQMQTVDIAEILTLMTVDGHAEASASCQEVAGSVGNQGCE